jgi:hypothetical protein
VLGGPGAQISRLAASKRSRVSTQAFLPDPPPTRGRRAHPLFGMQERAVGWDWTRICAIGVWRSLHCRADRDPRSRRTSRRGRTIHRAPGGLCPVLRKAEASSIRDRERPGRALPATRRCNWPDYGEAGGGTP